MLAVTDQGATILEFPVSEQELGRLFLSGSRCRLGWNQEVYQNYFFQSVSEFIII
jgi:hypothetical protein